MFRAIRRLARHRGKFAVAMTLATAVLAVLWNPTLKLRAESVWTDAVEWAGLAPATQASETTYWCPMHPQVKRNNPNDDCPICNMALVELEGDDTQPPEHLTLTPRQIQQTGVAYEPVVRRALYRELDTTGRIVCDERREAKITSWVRGKSRIEKLHVDFTGASVEQGELIAELYSPELIVAQQEVVLTARERNSRGIDLSSAARQKLRDQGLTAEQIDRLVRTGKVLERIPIHAPISGTVIERNVQEGQYVEEGEVLFHISDLSHLWLFADIHEEELPLVEVGQPAHISVRSRPEKEFEGTVDFIDPVVDRESRTVRVRIEIPNPGRRLKPGMYARVRLRKKLGERLAVPAGAVLWSGQRQVAIVRAADGKFQPREIRVLPTWLYAVAPDYTPGGRVEFGNQHKRYHEVLAGLGPGEQVVTQGAFLLNAESQFQSVLTKMLPPERTAATLEEAVGRVIAGRLRKLLDAYYGLTQALADDKLEAVPARSQVLVRAATELADQASTEQRSDLSNQARRLAELAGQLAGEGPDDLHAARTGFGRISHRLVALLDDHGGDALFGRELFLFRCGMAEVGYENWLWWSSEKFNPYMGQKMLRCGSRLPTLEP